MPEFPAPPAVLVPSPLYNLQLVLEELSGPQSAALLGACWGFAAFDPSAPSLAECDLPISWARYGELLKSFAGIQLDYFPADLANDAYDRVAFGQPVIVAVDSCELPYRPAYRRVNSARTIVVTRVDRATAEIVDAWMPAYAGTIRLEDLERARASLVPHDFDREPLYAGIPLERRWWTLALLADPLPARRDGVLKALSMLTAQAVEDATPEALDLFRRTVVAALSEPLLASRMARRAAALHLRGEIGLRAYLHAFLRFTVSLRDDPLLGAEVATWASHLTSLARARDVLIKSVVFDRPDYAAIVERALADAIGRERRFVSFMRDLCDAEPIGISSAGSLSC